MLRISWEFFPSNNKFVIMMTERQEKATPPLVVLFLFWLIILFLRAFRNLGSVLALHVVNLVPLLTPHMVPRAHHERSLSTEPGASPNTTTCAFHSYPPPKKQNKDMFLRTIFFPVIPTQVRKTYGQVSRKRSYSFVVPCSCQLLLYLCLLK